MRANGSPVWSSISSDISIIMILFSFNHEVSEFLLKKWLISYIQRAQEFLFTRIFGNIVTLDSMNKFRKSLSECIK